MDQARLTEVLEAFDDNADYRADGSVAKAKLFESACIRLSVLPVESSQGSRQRVVMDPKHLRGLAEEARQWIQAQGAAGGGVTFPDFQTLRSA